jgi:cell wall-active antibiotic response 4TMS protein YvqF
MAAQLKCHCQSCTIRGLVGPAVVITLGVLWLLHEVHGGRFYFGSTWPVLLIVAGLVHLASSMASRDGHASPASPPGAPPAPPTSGAATPQTPYSSQGQ